MISEKPPVMSGFSRVIGRLAEEFAKMGHVVNVLSAYDCKMKVFKDIKLVINAGNVSRTIKNGDHDIVNIHGHTPTFSDRLLLKSKLLGKKIVYTFHCPVDGFRPGDTIYNSVFNNIMLRLADAVIVTSKSYFDRLCTSFRKYIIPWGVDGQAFAGRRIPHEDYRLLFVGQLRPYKGLEVLLQAVKGVDCTLEVIGDGCCRSKYETYAKKLGVDNVKFCGAVGDEELKRFYLSSDVLVLPSVGMSEAFGLVTLEAAAAGCAVVASDLPGVRDVVKEFGVLVEPDDARSLMDALVAMKDEIVRKEYVHKGLKVVAKYSWRKVAEEYARIYRDILLRA